jgi:hypothetical protein
LEQQIFSKNVLYIGTEEVIKLNSNARVENINARVKIYFTNANGNATFHPVATNSAISCAR